MKPNHAKIAASADVALAIIAAAAISAIGPNRAGNNQRAIGETSPVSVMIRSLRRPLATDNGDSSNKRASHKTRKGSYEFFSTGISARAIAGLRVSRIHSTNHHTDKSNTAHPQRPGSNWLCWGRHRQDGCYSTSHRSN